MLWKSIEHFIIGFYNPTQIIVSRTCKLSTVKCFGYIYSFVSHYVIAQRITAIKTIYIQQCIFPVLRESEELRPTNGCYANFITLIPDMIFSLQNENFTRNFDLCRSDYHRVWFTRRCKISPCKVCFGFPNKQAPSCSCYPSC